MASEFTRKSILNECLYNGLYAPSSDPTPQVYSPSSSFLTSKTRQLDQQNAHNYERIMQRIRAGERRLPTSRVQTATVGVGDTSMNGQHGSYLQAPQSQSAALDSFDIRRAHSLSPNTSLFQNLGAGSGVSTPNLAQRGPQTTTVTAAPYSSLHSRHQEFLRQRRHDNALLSLGLDERLRSQSPAPAPATADGATYAMAVAPMDLGVDNMNPAVAPYAYTGATGTRPTYSVRNVPVRNIDEVRETIGIRRQYYRDRLFGRQDGEGEEGVEQNPEMGAGDDGTNTEEGGNAYEEGIVTEPEELVLMPENGHCTTVAETNQLATA